LFKRTSGIISQIENDGMQPTGLSLRRFHSGSQVLVRVLVEEAKAYVSNVWSNQSLTDGLECNDLSNQGDLEQMVGSVTLDA
jgi:hypothetical protein